MISIHEPTQSPALLASDWAYPWSPDPSDWLIGQTEQWAMPSIAELSELICRYPWAPARYWGGRRREANFLSSGLIVLDYDDGMTLLEAEVKFRRYRHIIATTKSHQKAKGDKPPCDRFRVVLFMLAPLFSITKYKSMYYEYVRLAGSDAQVKDGARFFFPCVDVISINYGFSIPYRFLAEEKKIAASVEVHRNKEQTIQKNELAQTAQRKVYKRNEKQSSNRRLAGMEKWKKNSFTEGVRNVSCFQAACDCFELGMSYHETESWIMGIGTSLDYAEVCSTIKSAQQKKRGA